MITPIARLPHYRQHMQPVVDILGEGGDTALVASYGDVNNAKRAGYRKIVLMQHGAGQSYPGDWRTVRHPSYAGGLKNDPVGLFLTPNDYSAARWRETYPGASVAVVGCPVLDSLPRREGGGQTVVAVSFHWNGHACPEMRSAFSWYRDAVLKLSRYVKVIGHKHPKAEPGIVAFYADAGIEYVEDWHEVCQRADLYVCDNSSTLFEFASTGRPTVVLDAPWYRRDIEHGLRFWSAADVGVRVGRPEYLQLAVGLALDDRNPELREAAVDMAYAYRSGAAQRAADAITAWIDAGQVSIAS